MTDAGRLNQNAKAILVSLSELDSPLHMSFENSCWYKYHSLPSKSLMFLEKFPNLKPFVVNKTYGDWITDDRKSIKPIHEDSIQIIDDFLKSIEEKYSDGLILMSFDLYSVL